MLIEISSLPPLVQQSIQKGERLEVANQGKIVATITANQPSYANGDFNYDLVQMQKWVESGEVAVPKINNTDEFLTWWIIKNVRQASSHLKSKILKIKTSISNYEQNQIQKNTGQKSQIASD